MPPTVLVYSSSPAVRERIRLAIGRRPAPDLEVSFLDASDSAAVQAASNQVDVCVLDGEAWPEGGLGIARTLKTEMAHPPACVVVVARSDDRWLARWSLAEAVVQHPVDPAALTEAVVGILRARAGVARSAAPAGTRRGLFG